jgi:non-heme chloroperoxidase
VIELLRVAVSPGVELEYARRKGCGHKLVFVHGYADSWYSFKGVLDALPPQFDAYSVTLSGHGGSTKTKADYSIIRYASDVSDFIRTMDIGRATIVGHSMGTFVAQELALSHPACVDRLVLIASAVTADNAVLRDLYGSTLSLTDPVPRAFAEGFQSGICVNPLGPGMTLDSIVDESAKLPAHVWRSALAGLIKYRPATFDPAALERLEVPTLVLGGEMDAIFPASDQRLLAQSLSNAQIHLDPRTGHSLNWEFPEDTAALVANFTV